jgi:hypothetical protein
LEIVNLLPGKRVVRFQTERLSVGSIKINVSSAEVVVLLEWMPGSGNNNSSPAFPRKPKAHGTLRAEPVLPESWLSDTSTGR